MTVNKLAFPNERPVPQTAFGGRVMSEDELRDQLASIVDSSDDAIIGESLDGFITSWNRGAECVFGYTADEIIGKPVAVLAWPEHEEDVASVLNQIRQGARVDHYETIRRTKDGRRLTISLTVSPIRNAEGIIVGASKVARDITGLREHEHVRSLLAAVVASSDDAIISKDLNGIVTSWNKGAERIFGYTAEEMIGQPIARTACPGREDDMLQILKRIRAGERIDHYETSRRCKDGREIVVSLTVSPIPDASGKIVGASKVARDITRQRQAENALREAEKLAVAGRMAASIAHEINNPLEALTNLLYLLDSEELGEKAREYLSAAQHELARVAHITAQTLRFHRESAMPDCACATELLEDALALHQGRLSTTGVVLERQYIAVPQLSCNPIELRQTLVNFIANALDAMPKGGKLCVRVRPATDWRTSTHGVRITVADTGQGMTQETRLRIFEPFYTTKGSTGTGLGLWVTSEIIAKYRGRIEVRSSRVPGRQGTVFAVFLPQ